MDNQEILKDNENITALNDAIGKLEFYNDILSKIDLACKNFAIGQFTYEESEQVVMGKAIIEFSKAIPKTLNFGVLYSIDSDDVRNNLQKYREEFNKNGELIESVENNLNEALINYDNFYIPTFNAVSELNSIYELDSDELGDYICEICSSYFCSKGISGENINSDLLLAILDKVDDEFISGYMFKIKNKLKEIQSLTPYSEVGLEIYKKPMEKKSVSEQISDDYNSQFEDILKNCKRDVD